jgi:hypothetical protein
MANLDFFATRADHEAILGFLFASTDIRMFESYSGFGQKLREFHSFEELTVAYDVGADPNGHGTAVLLQLWSPAVEPGPQIERIALDPRRCEGHTFRYCIDGWGLIQLYLGGIHGRTITKSHYGHNSEARARKWGYSDGVDWGALKSLSNRVQYHIRGRLSVARVPGRPVLAEAYGLARSGYALKEDAASPNSYRLPEVG